MTETPPAPDGENPEAQHLEAVPYDDTERVDAPDWYDDTTNVGDKANALAEALSRESEEPG